MENEEKKAVELTDEQAGAVSGGGNRCVGSSTTTTCEQYCNVCKQNRSFILVGSVWKCSECKSPPPKGAHLSL